MQNRNDITHLFLSINRLLIGLCAFLFISVFANAHEKQANATYLANEAVMVTSGDTKIMFDPLFLNGFGTFPLVPAPMLAKIMQGTAPFDGVDAIFVSHMHGDHFAAGEMVTYMQSHKQVRLLASKQAIDAMRELNPDDASIFERTTAFEMEVGDAPQNTIIDDLSVDVVRIVHIGNHPTVSNLVFRVTLNDGVTVMHMGDADVNDDHFTPYADHWAARQTDHAFSPFWFFGSDIGLKIVNERINAKTVTGIHVPINVPEPLKDSGMDYFSKPGESRTIPYHKEAAPHE